MEGEAAALALLGGAVATSILLVKDGIDDSNQDGVTAEGILSFVNVIAHGHQNQGTGKQRRKNYGHECSHCTVEKDWLGPVPLFDDKQFEQVFCITRGHHC
jgi:hypothetical protein